MIKLLTFFCVVNLINDSNSIQWYLDTYNDRYPNVMLPIASAGGGDLLLLGLKGEYRSKIYYWDHNFEAEKSGANYFENVTFISNCLSLF